jgi:acetyl-CoA synthetase
MDKVVEFDMAEAEIKWFTEAKLNIAKKLHR